MKIGFIVNIHISAMRPTDYLTRYLESLKHVTSEYHVYVIDNGSDKKYDFSQCDIKDKITYKYIEDQWAYGITGAWNVGTKLAVKDGCQILFGYNDDLVWNDSVNKLISYIQESYTDNVIYGPVSNNGGNYQTFDTAHDDIQEIPELHGFLWAFTDKLYHKVKLENGNFLDHSLTTDDGKWGGQEDIIKQYKSKFGIKHVMFGPTWIYHEKVHLWKEAREYDKGTEHHINLYKGRIK